MNFDIPNYRVLEKIGVGAQTKIYRARCMRSGKDYAVKGVTITQPEDVQLVEMLRTEYEVGTAVQHPVLREVYELRNIRRRFRLRGALLFMEYVDGICLSARDFRKPLDEVLRVFGQCAEALEAMHKAGWVHADLKPSNILYQADGRVKLIDFGQSSRMGEAKTRVQGTPDYIAPEQVRRDKLDARTDVFGLCAALHRVLTGLPLSTEMNRTLDMSSEVVIVKRAITETQQASIKLPTGIMRMIQDCCAQLPKDRLPDMAALRQRIETVRSSLARRDDVNEPEFSMNGVNDPADDGLESRLEEFRGEHELSEVFDLYEDSPTDR